MPLFDYLCKSCTHLFEFLKRGDNEPVCPKCGGADVEKQLSTFGVIPAGPTPAQKERDLMTRAGWVPVGKPFKNR